ncbi:histidine triad nucleotide-binding protein [Simiduia curdlanivorans]|uniref:Histidine triad nucleotide-binding protein n=1 Tax=Simiduia curdlanivorans TaxID=1492769 RepID=A0ABV8VC98_9GAMM|nr:histidine triad nucleotide-binding protein [Simiduia curdlanivorans]MDN3639310.1 histidine triad nucleotide-binding protein [Simiduia curdlanivorans]
MSGETIFSKIIRGDIPTEFVYEDEQCVCIADINPQAPVHLLVIPRKPIPRLVDATPEDRELLGHLMIKAGDIARAAGCGDAFRLIVNNGEQAGQTVFHLHLHILGNKAYTEAGLGF